MTADAFDYPDELHDNDESAFWRDVHEQAGSEREPHRGSYADYVAEVRRVAMMVPCPDCKAVVDEPCVRPAMGETPAGPLRKFAVHIHRETNARKQRA